MEFAKRMIKKQRGQQGEADPTMDEDQEWVQDFNWEAVASKRADRTTAWLAEATVSTRMLTFALVLSAFRYVTNWLLHKTRVVAECDVPPLLDFLHPSWSPLTKSLSMSGFPSPESPRASGP